MSHPDPHHDPENVRTDDSKFAPKQKLRVQKSKIAKRMNDGKAPKDNLKTIKAMIAQPASKAWFAKYGLPKRGK